MRETSAKQGLSARRTFLLPVGLFCVQEARSPRLIRTEKTNGFFFSCPHEKENTPPLGGEAQETDEYAHLGHYSSENNFAQCVHSVPYTEKGSLARLLGACYMSAECEGPSGVFFILCENIFMEYARPAD